MKLILYHGTSKENAERILEEGFVPDRIFNGCNYAICR